MRGSRGFGSRWDAVILMLLTVTFMQGLLYNPVKQIEKGMFYQQSPGGRCEGIHFSCASIHRRETNNRLSSISLLLLYFRGVFPLFQFSDFETILWLDSRAEPWVANMAWDKGKVRNAGFIPSRDGFHRTIPCYVYLLFLVSHLCASCSKHALD